MEKNNPGFGASSWAVLVGLLFVCSCLWHRVRWSVTLHSPLLLLQTNHLLICGHRRSQLAAGAVHAVWIANPSLFWTKCYGPGGNWLVKQLELLHYFLFTDIPYISYPFCQEVDCTCGTTRTWRCSKVWSTNPCIGEIDYSAKMKYWLIVTDGNVCMWIS